MSQSDVIYSNGIIAVDPDAAMDRARAARDVTRKSWDRLREVSDRHGQRALRRWPNEGIADAGRPPGLCPVPQEKTMTASNQSADGAMTADDLQDLIDRHNALDEIGRASCRERV